MSLFLFVVIAAAGVVVSLALAKRPWIGLVAGVGAIVVTLVALLVLDDPTPLSVEGVSFDVTPYARVLGSVALVTGLLVILVTAIDRPEPEAAPVLIAVVAGITIAMACSEVGVGLTFVAAAAFLASAIGLGTSAGETRANALLREVRGVVLGLLGGLTATALIGNGTPGSGAGGLPVEAPAAGIAFGVVAIVVAHRFGAVPLHSRVARIAATVPPAVLPAMLAVLPAAWGSVLLAWSAPAIAEYATGLPVERGLIVAAALLAMGLGSVAALLADDVMSVVIYMTVAESGLGLLALATVEASVVGPARTWLVVFVAGRTALLGWAIAFRAVFGTGHLRETRGWLWRAPLLGTTLVMAAIAGLGWPGMAAWDARVAILEASTGGPLLLLAYAASLGTVVAVGRLLAVGLGHRSERVVAAPPEIPRMPSASPPASARTAAHPAIVAALEAGDKAEAPGAAGVESGEVGVERERGGPRRAGVRGSQAAAGAGGGPRAILAANRTVLRALAMTTLAVVALVVAGGGLGLAAASATGAPAPVASQRPGGVNGPDGPSAAPAPSADPGASGGPAPSADPGAPIGAPPSVDPGAPGATEDPAPTADPSPAE